MQAMNNTQDTLESVEISIRDWLPSQELYAITIHDKHVDIECYISPDELDAMSPLILNIDDYLPIIED